MLFKIIIDWSSNAYAKYYSYRITSLMLRRRAQTEEQAVEIPHSRQREEPRQREKVEKSPVSAVEEQ